MCALFTGDVHEYQSECRQIITTYIDSDSPREKYYAAWTLALALDAVDDHATGIRCIRRALEVASDKQLYLIGLGAILMRAGKHEEAGNHFEQADAMSLGSPNQPTYLYLLRAINRWHVNDVNAAREFLAKGEASAERELASSPTRNREMTIGLLLSEAKSLIGSAAD